MRICGEWESKQDASRPSSTQERYRLIEGKLRNCLVLRLVLEAFSPNLPKLSFHNKNLIMDDKVRLSDTVV